MDTAPREDNYMKPSHSDRNSDSNLPVTLRGQNAENISRRELVTLSTTLGIVSITAGLLASVASGSTRAVNRSRQEVNACNCPRCSCECGGQCACSGCVSCACVSPCACDATHDSNSYQVSTLNTTGTANTNSLATTDQNNEAANAQLESRTTQTNAGTAESPTLTLHNEEAKRGWIAKAGTLPKTSDRCTS
jgi:hypothetical protein